MRAWVAALAAATLAGCAAAPIAPQAGPDPAVLSTISAWTASGRMAIAAGEHGGSGAFTWQQDAAVTRLSLRGPFGTGALEVTTDGEAFTLADGSGQVLDAAQARSRLESRLGTELPVSNLRYWMLGVPAPGIEAQVVDSPGEPRRLIEQTGWQIRYDEFMDSQGVILPARLTATSGSVRLKVIVDAWSLAGGAPVPKP